MIQYIDENAKSTHPLGYFDLRAPCWWSGPVWRLCCRSLRIIPGEPFYPPLMAGVLSRS